jgi:hypothetical protein
MLFITILHDALVTVSISLGWSLKRSPNNAAYFFMVMEMVGNGFGNG